MSISDDGPSRSSRAAAAMLVLVAALVGGVVTAPPAAAHGMLVAAESTPVEGARIGEPIDDLSLVFTEAPASFAFFAVTGPDGARVDDGWGHGEPFPLGTPVQEFNLVDGVWEPVYYSTGFPAQVGVAHWPAAGDYTVEYASVASDGDVVEGSYVFAYEGPPTQAPAGWTPPTDERDPQLAAAQGGEPAPGAEAAPSTAPTQAAPAPQATTEDAAAEGPGVQPAVYVVVALLVVGALTAIVLVGRRGRAAGAGTAGRAGARSGNPAVRAGAAPPKGRASARSGNPAVRAGARTGPRGNRTDPSPGR